MSEYLQGFSFSEMISVIMLVVIVGMIIETFINHD